MAGTQTSQVSSEAYERAKKTLSYIIDTSYIKKIPQMLDNFESGNIGYLNDIYNLACFNADFQAYPTLDAKFIKDVLSCSGDPMVLANQVTMEWFDYPPKLQQSAYLLVSWFEINTFHSKNPIRIGWGPVSATRGIVLRLDEEEAFLSLYDDLKAIAENYKVLSEAAQTLDITPLQDSRQISESGEQNVEILSASVTPPADAGISSLLPWLVAGGLGILLLGVLKRK